MAALALDAATERVAINLLRHLEWQADGFSLVFLFADVGPSLQLADWLDQRLVLQGRALQREEVRDHFVAAPEATVDALVARCAAISARPGASWFGLQRHPSDARWNRARSLFLARLNERRFLLERDLSRPLVLVLPADFRSEARNIAPDIWHVRALSEELRSIASSGRLIPGAPGLVTEGSTIGIEVGTLPAYTEWQRMQASGKAASAFLPTAWRACEELLAHGRPADAEQVAAAAQLLARRRVAQSPAPSALRDLSVSLDNVGQVARAQGDWSQAEAVYRESLDLSRHLVERLGGTPEALEDMASSLLNVAGVPPANAAMRDEAIQLYETLASSFPGNPRYPKRLASLRGDNPDPTQSEAEPAP